MLFNSLAFALFLPIVLSLYLLLPSRRSQNFLLLVASYFFYGCWDWRFLSLILISTLIDYHCGLALAATDDDAKRKRYLAVSVCANLLLLGFFKYFNFFADSLHMLAQTFGISLGSMHLNIILPVGISFYTFQTMSYTIDIYRRQMQPTKSFLNFALYVAFFPQLVAGPIERAQNLLPRIERDRLVTWQHLQCGMKLIAWGLFKKVAVADVLAVHVDRVFSAETYLGGEVLLASYCFLIQVYCDFSGYSDIARGCSRCMGIDLMLNFRRPLFAQTFREFWARWHISLSTWLRDYLYFPLGGSRCGAWQSARNLLVTMTLAGLWHGAAWTYVLWGMALGIFLLFSRWIASYYKAHPQAESRQPFWLHIVRVIYCFHLIALPTIMFRSRDMAQAWQMLQTLVSWDTLVQFPWAFAGEVGLYLLPLFIVELVQEYFGDEELIPRFSWPIRWVAYAALAVYFVKIGASEAQAFVYFQF